MKTLNNILAIAMLLLITTSCKNDTQPEIKTVEIENNTVAQNTDPNATYAKVEFGIDGMTCAVGCAKTIEKKMAKMDGVKSAKVDFDKRLAMVEYDEAKVTPQSLEEAVAAVGDVYKVKDMKTVTSFETEKSCSADCKMACCADKTAKNEDKPCPADCQKDCCKDKKKS